MNPWKYLLLVIKYHFLELRITVDIRQWGTVVAIIMHRQFMAICKEVMQVYVIHITHICFLLER